MERESRPTLRCLRDDIDIKFDWDTPLDGLDHPLLKEAKRVAPTSPMGQKRIVSIQDTMIYRVRTSDWRGATWVESAENILWLVAAGRRRDGDHSDFYNHVSSLHDRQRLLPDDDDWRKWRAEQGIRWMDQLSSDLRLLVNQTRLAPGQEHAGLLCQDVQAVAIRRTSDDPAEWWLGLRVNTLPGWLDKQRAMEMVAGLAAEMIGATQWEWRRDWPYPKSGSQLVIWFALED